jgi:hypothetical protein
MMMKMLEAGGLPPLTDHIRRPNEDNPEGYYEFERVKKLPKGDTLWLAEAHGKAVKIIATLLQHLPPTYTYNVLFMRRNLKEVVASQNKMLLNRNEAPNAMDEVELAELFNNHLAHIYLWLDQQPHIRYLNINYNQLLQEPEALVDQINRFLNANLDTAQMAAVVDPNLYRQRASDLAGRD